MHLRNIYNHNFSKNVNFIHKTGRLSAKKGSLFCSFSDSSRGYLGDPKPFLELAFKNSYHDFESIENNPVWDDVKESDEFKELIQKYKQSASL